MQKGKTPAAEALFGSTLAVGKIEEESVEKEHGSRIALEFLHERAAEAHAEFRPDIFDPPSAALVATTEGYRPLDRETLARTRTRGWSGGSMQNCLEYRLQDAVPTLRAKDLTAIFPLGGFLLTRVEGGLVARDTAPDSIANCSGPAAPVRVESVNLGDRQFLAAHTPPSGVYCFIPSQRYNPLFNTTGDTQAWCFEWQQDPAVHWGAVRTLPAPSVVRLGEWHGHVGTPKSNRVRVVPLTQDVVEVLRALPRTHARVFIHKGKSLTYDAARWAIKKACRDAGVPHASFHPLRHTFATELDARGAHPKTIQDLLGHSTLAMTMRYLHTVPEATRAAVNLLQTRREQVWAVCGQPDPNSVHPDLAAATTHTLHSPLYENENTALMAVSSRGGCEGIRTVRPIQDYNA